MEFKVAVPDLSKALARVQGIVEKKTTMPILANVLIETKGSHALRVSATNLEIGLTGTYPAQVEEGGSITLAGKALHDIVRSLPEQTLHFRRTANNWVEISSGTVNFKVVGIAADSFPSLPKFEVVDFFPVDQKVFKDMIDKTLFSVSTDEMRYNLTGVFTEPTEKGLRMVSTDGHRLALIERELPAPIPLRKGVIIPRKGIAELRKILDDGGAGEPKLGFVDNSVVFERGEITLTMQLLEGQFPDYNNVIPTKFAKKAVIERERLLSALKRTSLLSPDKAQGVRLEFSPSMLALTANNPDLGEAREELPIEYQGEVLRIGFNFRYLLDVMQVLSDEKIEFHLSDPLSPGLIVGLSTPNYRAIVMPMRL